MNVTLPESGDIGVEIESLDVDALDATAVSRIKDLVYRHRLVILRDQRLTKERYLALARTFGRPQIYFQDHYHHPDHPEIFVSSNVPENGSKVGVAGTGRFWHSDYQFFEEPLSLTMVAPQVVPAGTRETYFIDMVQVYAMLPPELKTHTVGARAYHDATMYYKVQPKDIDRAIIDLIREFREIAPGAAHPMVIRHPVTGEESLYISEGFTTGILGLGTDRARDVLSRMFAFVGRPEHVHVHPWREGDVLFWDNRTLIHRASEIPPGQPSVSYRIGVYDGLPFYTNEIENVDATERAHVVDVG